MKLITEREFDQLAEDFNVYVSETGLDLAADFDYEESLDNFISHNLKTEDWNVVEYLH